MLTSRLKLLLPRFLRERLAARGEAGLFNYRRIWWQAIIGVASVALLPVAVLSVLNHSLYSGAFTTESLARVDHQLSDMHRSVGLFLQERKSALQFIVADNDYAALSDQRRLTDLFAHMTAAYRGFVDIGVIDSTGVQVAYVGPYELRGRNYSRQAWFEQVRRRGFFVSDVFRGFRDVPHFVIAARHDQPDGGFYIVRATIDAERLGDLLVDLDPSAPRDAFIINREGVLQTDSNHHGSTLDRLDGPVPAYSTTAVVTEARGDGGDPRFIGSVAMADTPFILVVTREPAQARGAWWQVRGTLVGILLASVVGILIAVVLAVTYLVEKVYEADLRRIVAIHHMEHTNKIASIGRLAAGVAHEINNPLAIISERAGLLKDLFTFSGEYEADEKLLGIVDSILRSVKRCSRITHRLLSFAKHVDVVFEEIDLAEVIREVLSLLGKEADHRDIRLVMAVAEETPRIVSDKGLLQQIYLNIINNAFAAVEDGGEINIDVRPADGAAVATAISDNGCGIPTGDLKRIFEPFFSTKGSKGTGLGLSITYGLVNKLGGTIDVRSTVGVGTSFTVKFPVNLPESVKERLK
jgi:signal transduction histidine kinase